MDTQTLELLGEIQRLSIAAHEQTGIPTAYTSYNTMLEDHPLIIHAGVTIMPAGGEPWSMKGTTSPYRGANENDLAGLRDELARWIADHRIREDAA